MGKKNLADNPLFSEVRELRAIQERLCEDIRQLRREKECLILEKEQLYWKLRAAEVAAGYAEVVLRLLKTDVVPTWIGTTREGDTNVHQNQRETSV